MMNTRSYVCCSIASTPLHFHVACIVRPHVSLHFRLYYEFERGFLHLSCGLLINCDHVFIFISLSSFVISIKISILNSWLIMRHLLFFFLFLSISFKLLSSIFFFPTSFLLNHLWGIIFHAWSTLVLWFLYLSSYIKNLIFCLIWSNLSICCPSSISFRFRSWGGSNY